MVIRSQFLTGLKVKWKVGQPFSKSLQYKSAWSTTLVLLSHSWKNNFKKPYHWKPHTGSLSTSVSVLKWEVTWFNTTMTALRGMCCSEQPILRHLNQWGINSFSWSWCLLHPKLESKTSLPALMAVVSEAEVMQTTLCVHRKDNGHK